MIVAIIDGRIDDKNCDFDATTVKRWITLLPPEAEAPIDRPQDGKCDAGIVTAPGVFQHGTHVASIIAAKPDATIGPGVYPFARIDSYEAVVDGASVKFIQTVAALSEKLLFEQPRVVNVSSVYTRVDLQTADPFAQDLLGSHSPLSAGTLFVAAAGNFNSVVSDARECVYLPACYSRDHANVISVIALDDDGGVAKLDNGLTSNSGVLFDVGAPGVNVPSSAPGDLVALMSGTSQAAPIVSGVADHVFALRAGARPGDVKRRLIYTSDLLPGLRGRLFGGRLNVDAAVSDIDVDVVTLTNGTVLRGRADTTDVKLRFRVFGTRMVKRVALSEVKRLVHRDDQASWDVFMEEQDAGSTTSLKRYTAIDVDFVRIINADEIHNASFDFVDDQGSEEVEASGLKDFIIKMGD